MEPAVQPIVLMTLCILMLMVMFMKNGIRDPLFAVGLFYFYFGYGPVISWLMGRGIYFGTLTGRIGEATLIFTLATGGMFVVAMASRLPDRGREDTAAARMPGNPGKGLWIVYSCLAIYGLAAVAWVAPEVFHVDKIGRIELLGRRLHYQYVLLQAFAVSTYFMVLGTRVTRRLYFTNLAVYCLYCLVAAERDFIFLVTSLILHSTIVSRVSFRRLVSIALFVAIMTAGSMYVVVLRDQTWRHTGLSSFLNQGSLLFINTQVIDLVRSGYRPEMGYTYVNSVLSLLPSWIYEGKYSLLAWFVELYAPASRSGYGFALDAEAYLNFGYPGVPVFFALVAWLLRQVHRRMNVSHFYRYLSVFLTGFLMYSLRNDSLALIKGSVYAALFFLALAVLAHVMERLERG